MFTDKFKVTQFLQLVQILKRCAQLPEPKNLFEKDDPRNDFILNPDHIRMMYDPGATDLSPEVKDKVSGKVNLDIYCFTWN